MYQSITLESFTKGDEIWRIYGGKWYYVNVDFRQSHHQQPPLQSIYHVLAIRLSQVRAKNES
jgi:hypothetical protein